MKKYEFILKNLDCPNCARGIQEKLGENPKLHNVNVNFAKLKLTYETEDVTLEEIKQIVKEQEPEVEIIPISSQKQTINNEEAKHKEKLQIIRLVVGILIAMIGFSAKLPEIASNILIILGYAILLYRTIKNAIKLLIKSKTINENLLITISCIGAYLVGEQLEGLMVIILYEIGKILEERAVNKSRKSITELMNIKPEYANLKIEEEIKQVSPEEVKIGDVVIVKQGEKVPLDGKIIKGEATLNTSSLTGESKPIQAKEQMQILSGSIVTDGIIEIEITEKYENSTVNKILELVENATDKKAKTETFVNKASKIYTPIVLGLATAVAIFLPMFTNIEYTGSNGSIYRALIFLVISCPCSIAISVPLSYFSGIGKSSKEGILIKGSDYLDSLKDIKEIFFDKTGTLTTGEFEVQKVDANGEYSKEDILKIAAIGESFSNHPIAKSIVKSNKQHIEKDKITEFKEIAGKGLSYKYEGKQIMVGNATFVQTQENEESETKIYVKIDEKIAGIIYLGDSIKAETKSAIEKLKQLGIKVHMLTGDNKKIAEKIGKEIGIGNIKSEMLPEDKYRIIEQAINQKENEQTKIAFVGDGINDSPVLARADIGISMGGVGSESAIEASDVVIMTDNIKKIEKGIVISKKTCKIIKENLIFAFGTKILILLLSTIGIAGMWEAIFADVGVTLITILNTLRILR